VGSRYFQPSSLQGLARDLAQAEGYGAELQAYCAAVVQAQGALQSE
jgi:hypothetical protein